MSIKEKKLKILKNMVKKYDYLLNICNKIEYNLNYVNDFEYTKYNLINIHAINENTFNFNLWFEYNNLKSIDFYKTNKNFNKKYSYVYKTLNNLIDYLENIIKCYSKYIKKDILLIVLINNLCLNTENKDLHKFFNLPIFYNGKYINF